MDENTSFIIMLAVTIPFACFLYLYLFRLAIMGAIKEHQGEKSFNRLYLVAVILPILIIFLAFERPFSPTYKIPSAPIGLFFLIAGFAYVAIEIPFQLVKSAAIAMGDELQALAEDKRTMARVKSAETLAEIIREKLKATCELQAFSSNGEFVFLTYIINNKPFATRLKLNHADNAENWKKLGERIIQSFQTEPNPSETSPS